MPNETFNVTFNVDSNWEPVEDFKAKNPYRPKLVGAIDKLETEIKAGVYDNATLLEALRVSSSAIKHTLRYYMVSIELCGGCRQFKFAKTLEPAYGGLSWVCPDCRSIYVKCGECNTLRLMDDNNHIHIPTFIKFMPWNTVHEFNIDVLGKLGPDFRLASDERKPKWGSPMYFGVEFELERKRDKVIPPDLVMKAMMALSQGLAIVKRDGSLQIAPGDTKNGSNGFEVVTVPATKRYHLMEAGWERFFDAMQPFAQESPPTAGLHMHLSCNAVTPLVIGKVTYFINNPDNLSFLIAMADRDFTKANPVTGRVYAPVFGNPKQKVAELITKRKHNDNCPAAASGRVLRIYRRSNTGNRIYMDPFGNPVIQTLDSGAAAAISCNCPTGEYTYKHHYAAFNVKTNKPTVEFRLFRASMNIMHFFAALDFCDALMYFCRDAAMSNLTTQGFIEWFGGVRPHYPHLAKWLVATGYIEPRKNKKDA